MPIRSMTGFARVARSTSSGELTLSIKSVNHKGLDMHFHMPSDLDALEPPIRTAVRNRIVRGHVQVQISLRRNADEIPALALNEPLLRGWLAAFQNAAKLLEMKASPDLNQAFRIPGVLDTQGSERSGLLPVGDALEHDVLSATQDALDALDQFRMREGEAIEAELLSRTEAIRSIVHEMEAIRSRALPHFHQRLKEKLAELLGATQIDTGRIAVEAAMLAERSDISEELLRLKTHAEQVDELIAAPGETGKKLDFLLQEMNRETNTILSKTSGLGEPGLKMTDIALAAKAEIDRIREQSLNVE